MILLNDYEYVYICVYPLSRRVKVGHADNRKNLTARLSAARKRFEEPCFVHSIICGSYNDEKNIHKYFHKSLMEGSDKEIFWIDGHPDWLRYLNYLGNNPFVASSEDGLDDIAPNPNLLPSKILSIEATGLLPLLDFLSKEHALTPATREAKQAILLEKIRNSKDTYVTPSYVVNAIERVIGGKIYCDPATTPEINQLFINATEIFTIEENGILHPWHKSVLCFPPYHGEASKFVKHGIDQQDKGNITHLFFLLNAQYQTEKWFHKCGLTSFWHCVPDHRIRFLGGLKTSEQKSSNPFYGTCIYYRGPNHSEFCRVFASIGAAYAPSYVEIAHEVDKAVCILQEV